MRVISSPQCRQNPKPQTLTDSSQTATQIKNLKPPHLIIGILAAIATLTSRNTLKIAIAKPGQLIGLQREPILLVHVKSSLLGDRNCCFKIRSTDQPRSKISIASKPGKQCSKALSRHRPTKNNIASIAKRRHPQPSLSDKLYTTVHRFATANKTIPTRIEEKEQKNNYRQQALDGILSHNRHRNPGEPQPSDTALMHNNSNRIFSKRHPERLTTDAERPLILTTKMPHIEKQIAASDQQAWQDNIYFYRRRE